MMTVNIQTFCHELEVVQLKSALNGFNGANYDSKIRVLNDFYT